MSRTNRTPRQKRQLAYARAMKTVRARARTTRGGKGRIAKRSTATRLRRKFRVGGPAKRVRVRT